MVRVFKGIGATGCLRAAAALVVLGVGGCSSLDNTSSGSGVTAVASNSLSAITGGKTAEEANQEIELRARHPLVLPPDYNLRPPVDPAQEEQQLGAAWPVDPDVKAKEEEALAEARRKAEYEKLKQNPQGRAAPLTPEELAAGMVDPRTIAPETQPQMARVAPGEALSPEELLERHRAQQQAGQPVAIASQQGARGETPDDVQYQTQEVVEPQAPPPPPKKDGLLDRLVFWD